MNPYITLAIGLFVGASLGVLAMAIVVAGKHGDQQRINAQLLAACGRLAYYIGSLWEADECHCNEGEQPPCWHCRAMKAVTEAEAVIANAKQDG